MDMQQLLKQAQDMQQKFQEAQSELEDKEFTGQAGGGMVSAVVNGKGSIKELDIDPEVVDSDEVEMLEDMIVSAIETATESAEEEKEEVLDGMGPGGGMGGLDTLLG